LDELPREAIAFVDRIVKLVDVPVTMLGIGQKREQMVHMIPVSQSAPSQGTAR
jgi:adenylosuccinate synthase